MFSYVKFYDARNGIEKLVVKEKIESWSACFRGSENEYLILSVSLDSDSWYEISIKTSIEWNDDLVDKFILELGEHLEEDGNTSKVFQLERFIDAFTTAK